MSQSKTVFMFALSVLLCVGINLGASDDEDSGGKGGLHGVQEFFTSGTFTVPKHVTRVMVTMWGAGGGQGAGSSPTPPSGCWSGGFGGGGAYTNTVVPVVPDATYTVTVGKGGAGAQNIGDNGTDGGDSQFSLGSTILAFAGGGKAGGAATSSGPGVNGGAGQIDSTAQISHNSTSQSFGYATNLIPVQAYGVANPSFATGGSIGNGCPVGENGGPGYVLLTF